MLNYFFLSHAIIKSNSESPYYAPIDRNLSKLLLCVPINRIHTFFDIMYATPKQNSIHQFYGTLEIFMEMRAYTNIQTE